jgi:hypothetical protein
MAGSLTTRLASEVEESQSDTPATSSDSESGDGGSQRDPLAAASPFLMNYDFDQIQVDREVLRDAIAAAGAIGKFL